MTVGREIAARSTFRLFHNHHTIEPLREVFGYGTEPFETLNLEFRRRVIEEAALAGVDLIFSFVWDLQDPRDNEYVQQIVAPYEEADGEVWILELAADLGIRLDRNRGASRLAAKPSKQDLEWSENNVIAMESLQMTTDGSGAVGTPAEEFFRRHPHLRLDTTSLTAVETAEIALSWLEVGREHRIR